MRNAFSRRLSARWMARLLTIITLFSATATAQENPVSADVFPTAYEAQAVQDVLYVLLEDKLVALPQDTETPTTVLNFSAYPEVNWPSALLFTDGAHLFLLDSLTETVYQIEGDSLWQTVQLDVSKLVQKDGNAPASVVFQYPVMQGGYLYVLCLDFSDFSNRLCRFSLDSGKQVSFSTKEYAFQELVAYRDEQLLGIDFNTRNLVVIDAASGNAVDEIETASDSRIGAIAYDSAKDCIYARRDAEVVRWENRKPVAVGYLAAGDASDAFFVGIWRGAYAFMDRSGLHACATASEAAKVKPLTIWSDVVGLLDSKQLTGFMNLYPQTPVVFRAEENANPMDKISAASVTGDASIDIFAVSSQQVNGKEIFRRGYAAALDSAALKEDVLSMYPQVQQYLTENGVLFGFPAALWTKFWTVQPNLLDEAQLGAIPEQTSDYYAMMNAWYGENDGGDQAVTFDGNQTIQEEWREAIYFLSSQYIYTYASAGKPISFNTPVFRAALEQVALLAQWKGDDTAQSDGEEHGQSIFQPNSVEPFAQNLNPEQLGEQYILPPRFADAPQPILDSTMVYFMVNPYSQNQEAAIQFLEFFSQSMDLMLQYELHPNDNAPVERQGYQMAMQADIDDIAGIKARIAALTDKENPATLKDELVQAEAALAQEEKNRWVYPPEVIETYRKLAPYIRMDYGDLIWEINDTLDIQTILMSYFEGLVSLDQALSNLDKKVAMLYLEAQ